MVNDSGYPQGLASSKPFFNINAHFLGRHVSIFKELPPAKQFSNLKMAHRQDKLKSEHGLKVTCE